MSADLQFLNGRAIKLAAPATAAPPTAGKVRPSFRCERLKRGPWIQVGRVTSFEFTRIHITMDALPESLAGVRIMHLSDLHLCPRWDPVYERLVTILHDDPPDLIVLTGDFVEHRANFRRTLPMLQRVVTQLRSRHGIYGILGNHDGDLLGPRLREWGVHIICGRVARLESADSAIELVGVPSVSRKDVTPESVARIPPRSNGAIRLALTHFPDSILKLQQLDADIILAGHTHGGQLCLPGRLPLITHDSLPRRMCHGVHELDGKLLVVNRGIGFASVPMRLFSPPEVVEIRFRTTQTCSDQNSSRRASASSIV